MFVYADDLILLENTPAQAKSCCIARSKQRERERERERGERERERETFVYT